MGCGVPVVISDRASLPEIAGGAALEVSPEGFERPRPRARTFALRRQPAPGSACARARARAAVYVGALLRRDRRTLQPDRRTLTAHPPTSPCASLFLTPQLPYPPRQGTTIRNWGLISRLTKRHTISLLSFGVASAVPEVLRARCEHVVVVPTPQRPPARRVADLALGHADLARRLWAPAFQKALADWLARERFDGVQVEALSSPPICPRSALTACRWCTTPTTPNTSSRRARWRPTAVAADARWLPCIQACNCRVCARSSAPSVVRSTA